MMIFVIVIITTQWSYLTVAELVVLSIGFASHL